MNRTPTEKHLLLGGDGQARALRTFLFALVGTPWLLFLEPARRIVTLEATIAAIGLGISLGIGAAVGLADVDRQDVNDVTAVVAALVCICVTTVVIWLLVPHRYAGTVVQFALVFSWTMPVTQLLYHRYRASGSS